MFTAKKAHNKRYFVFCFCYLLNFSLNKLNCFQFVSLEIHRLQQTLQQNSKGRRTQNRKKREQIMGKIPIMLCGVKKPKRICKDTYVCTYDFVVFMDGCVGVIGCE